MGYPGKVMCVDWELAILFLAHLMAKCGIHAKCTCAYAAACLLAGGPCLEAFAQLATKETLSVTCRPFRLAPLFDTRQPPQLSRLLAPM